MWSHKMGGLLTQVNPSETCTFETLQGLSLNTGDLYRQVVSVKDRFDCTGLLVGCTL